MKRWDLEEPLPNMRQLNVVYRHLRARLPDLGDITPVRAWAGHIDGTPDGLPIIESLSSPHGLVLATAFSGHGFALGPAVGSVVADLVVDGRTSVELNPMRLGRFSERTFGQPKSIL